MYLNFTPVPRAILTGTEARYRVEDLEDFLKSVLTGCPSSCHISADHIAALEDGALLAEWFPDDTPEVQEVVEEVHAEMAATLRMGGDTPCPLLAAGFDRRQQSPTTSRMRNTHDDREPHPAPRHPGTTRPGGSSTFNVSSSPC